MEKMNNNRENESEHGQEQEPGEILDVLESAFNDGTKAELTVAGPNGELRTNSVFVEGFEAGVLYVADSKSTPVMPLEISSIKKAKLIAK